MRVGWRRLSTKSAGVGEKQRWLTGLAMHDQLIERQNTTTTSKALVEHNLHQVRTTPPAMGHVTSSSSDHSIRHMPFPIGGQLEQSLYLQPFSRYLAPKHVNEHTNERIRQ